MFAVTFPLPEIGETAKAYLKREEEVKIDVSQGGIGIDVTKNVTVLTENFPKYAMLIQNCFVTLLISMYLILMGNRLDAFINS